jgi:hypothetical protein
MNMPTSSKDDLPSLIDLTEESVSQTSMFFFSRPKPNF